MSRTPSCCMSTQADQIRQSQTAQATEAKTEDLTPLEFLHDRGILLAQRDSRNSPHSPPPFCFADESLGAVD